MLKIDQNNAKFSHIVNREEKGVFGIEFNKSEKKEFRTRFDPEEASKVSYEEENEGTQISQRSGFPTKRYRMDQF